MAEVEKQEPLVIMKECVEQVKNIASTLKSDVEEPLVFRSEWVDQVKDMMKDNKSMANAGVIPRVARPLLNVKPELYIPQFVSLGPYHHSRLENDMGSSSAGGTYEFRELKMSTAEVYKVKSAATLWQKLRDHGNNFDELVERIRRMQPDIQRFYDWPISKKDELYSQNFALMMTVDSSFLLSFLVGLFGLHDQPQLQPADTGSPSSDDDMITTLSTLQICIKCDILKLENQIPLSVLKEVFHYVENQIPLSGESDPAVCAQRSSMDQDFNNVLYKTYNNLCPFDQMGVKIDEARLNQGEPHLLGFMHALVSPFLQMKAGGMDLGPNRTFCEKTKHFLKERVAAVCGFFMPHPSKKGQRDFLNAYNAKQLDKAGIKFQSFSDPREGIRFDKYSETLYLPRITVSHIHTEVFLRNMLALEFNDPRRNCVTSYVGLMDCLIDTEDDVRLLMDSHVIRRRSLMLTDEYIAKMWDGLCQPFFTGHLEPPKELKEALEKELVTKYYKSKIKSVLREFYGEHLSRPWKVIALFIAICVFIITVLEGYCTFYECTRQSKSSRPLWVNAA